MATRVQIPEYEYPVARFLRGEADLRLYPNQVFFNLWEAILMFGKDDYPLQVDRSAQEITRDEIFLSAAENVVGKKNDIIVRRGLGEKNYLQICQLIAAEGFQVGE